MLVRCWWRSFVPSVTILVGMCFSGRRWRRLLNIWENLSSIAAMAFSLNCRWALSLRSRSSREGFSFLLPEQKKRNKENSPSALFGLLRQVFPLNKKNSLTLKQLFVFHAPTLTSASRPKSEAGPFCFFLCNIASLVGVWCFLSSLRSFFLSSRAERRISCTSTPRAKRCALQRRATPASVEKREEIFAFFR